MAEYGMEQRIQLSRAIAYSEIGNSQLKRFVDNRQNETLQLKNIIQRAEPVSKHPELIKKGIEDRARDYWNICIHHLRDYQINMRKKVYILTL